MKKIIGLCTLLITGFANAELVSLNENSLGDINAQNGINLDLGLFIDVGSISYTDVNVGSAVVDTLEIKDISIAAATAINEAKAGAYSEHKIDIDETNGLYIDSLFQATRIKIGGVSVGELIGTRSFGQFQLEFEGTNLLNIGNNNQGAGFLINNSTHLKNVDFQWSTNGNTFHAEGITIDSVLKDAVFEEKEISVGQTALVIGIAGFNSDIYIAAMCLSSAACVNTGATANSLGSLSRSINHVDSQITIQGGGRIDEGITMNMNFKVDESYNIGGSNQTLNGNFISYTDEKSITLSQQSGEMTVSNLTFDIGHTTEHVNGYSHLALQLDQLKGNVKFADISIAGNSVGGFEAIFDFSDGAHGGYNYKNKLILGPGLFTEDVMGESDGITIYNEWNMAADLIYTDDGNNLYVDNIKTYGWGDTTLDLRAGGAQSIDTTNGPETFLAIGIVGHEINYTFDGLKLGENSAGDAIEVAQEAHFTLNAELEVRGGGANGSGITLDADIRLTDGSFGITRSSVTGNGIYLDGMNFDTHLRDVTFDVDDGGIQLVLGELWSYFSVNDIRFGDYDTSDSMGALIIQTYSKGSTIAINGGGDSGAQGLTIASKSLLQKRAFEYEGGVLVAVKENSIAYVASRSGGAIADGAALKLDNIYTSDGYNNDDNAFGVKNVTSVDVAEYAGQEAIVLSNNLQFKELNIDSVQIIYPVAGGVADTLVHDIMLQNLNLTSTLSVMPIQ